MCVCVCVGDPSRPPCEAPKQGACRSGRRPRTLGTHTACAVTHRVPLGQLRRYLVPVDCLVGTGMLALPSKRWLLAPRLLESGSRVNHEGSWPLLRHCDPVAYHENDMYCLLVTPRQPDPPSCFPVDSCPPDKEGTGPPTPPRRVRWGPQVTGGRLPARADRDAVPTRYQQNVPFGVRRDPA